MTTLVFIIVLLPFMQIGVSYWLAGHIALLSCLVFADLKRLKKYFLSNQVWLRALGAYALVLSAALYSDVSSGDMLYSTREAFCFYLIAGSGGLLLFPSPSEMEKLLRVLAVFSIFMFFLTLIQTAFLAQGVYFGLPQDWFVINSGTLPDELDLLYSRIRPMGSYGEPSYLAAVCLTLMFGVSQMWDHSHKVRWIILCLLFVILLSRSMSGILSATLIISFVLLKSRMSGFYVIISVFFLALMFLGVIYFELGIFARFNSISRGEDVSFLVRVWEPLKALPVMLVEFPTGIPFRILLDQPYVSSELIEPRYLVQNGILRMVFTCGFLGVLVWMIIVFLYRRKPEFLFLLFILANQNGSLFSTDKVVLVSLGFILWNTVETYLDNNIER